MDRNDWMGNEDIQMKETISRYGLRGELTVPGDKSISHRSVMFGALADGTTEITGFLRGADCLSTIRCFEKMGICTEILPDRVLVHGKGLHGLTAPSDILDCGNSGTTTRLISGILAGQNFNSRLTGDASLCRRPMRRILIPLGRMGADIASEDGNDCLPLRICGRPLHGIHYDSPVASAQVKSSILLAGLTADGPTSVTEPHLSRNHTEILLRSFGADIRSEGTTATIYPAEELTAQKIAVPGDISSAAFFIAAALIVPGSEIRLRNIGINPTRDGMIRVCREMGGRLNLENVRREAEPRADLLVQASSLHGITIGGDIVPALIDELPVIAVMACFAEGTTVIRDAQELKVKESNRIRIMTEGLRRMGADCEETEDGMIIRGGRPLHGASVDSASDHRAAMSFAVASLMADGETNISDPECVKISYPEFYRDLHSLIAE